MKKLLIISCALAIGLFSSHPAEARIDVGLGINLGGPAYAEPVPAYIAPEPAPAYVVAPDYGRYNGRYHYDRRYHHAQGYRGGYR